MKQQIKKSKRSMERNMKKVRSKRVIIHGFICTDNTELLVFHIRCFSPTLYEQRGHQQIAISTLELGTSHYVHKWLNNDYSFYDFQLFFLTEDCYQQHSHSLHQQLALNKMRTTKASACDYFRCSLRVAPIFPCLISLRLLKSQKFS